MRQRNILMKVFLVILCLPLSACLLNVSGKSGAKYPIGEGGVVNLTKAQLTDLQNLKLSGYNLFPAGNRNVSLECKYGGVFTPIYDPNITTTSFNLITQSWSLIAENCDLEQDGDNYVIELAVKLGDKYAPILTKGNVNCIVGALITEKKKLLPAIEGCVASDPRTPASTDPYGFNTEVQGINVLKLLVPQAAL